MRKSIPKSIRRLINDIQFLNELIEDPRKSGSLILIRKIRGESKLPTNEVLRDFRDDIEADIKYVSWKIRYKLGFKLPDGLK